ncbi:MAG: hypothetical protein L0221_15185 [Chloroflexi bacterium]|nr:hypothetical protein [Chloroflexota bacterium]
MLRRLRSVLALAGLIGLALTIAPGVEAGDPCYHGYTVPPVTSAATSTVNLEPCAMVPTTALVAPGTTVTFTNVSPDVHLVVGANGTWGDRDREIAAGASVTVRFAEPGIYPYSCALHRGMTGVIVVRGADTTDAVAASDTAAAETAATDQATILAITGFAGLALVGWGVALVQRRRPAA